MQKLRRSSRIKTKQQQNIEKVDNPVTSGSTSSTTSTTNNNDIDPAILITTNNDDKSDKISDGNKDNNKTFDLEKPNNMDINAIISPPITSISSNTIITEEAKKTTNKRKKSEKSTKKTKKQDEQQITEAGSSSSSTNNKVDDQTDKNTTTKQKGKKKARLDTKKTKEPEEKRLAKFRTSCSTKVKERIERAMSQRMYLVDRSEVKELHHEFVVLGSVGNVYNIEISTLPKCNCPDFTRGNLCKHILFVYLKVLRVNPNSSYIYQKALLTSELRQLFQNAAPNPTVLANKRVRDKYAMMVESSSSSDDVPDTTSGKRPRQPIEGDCPICYEALLETEKLVWCKDSCGNNVHEICFNQWKASKRSSGEITCVYCRNKWEEEIEVTSSKDGKYINLGEAQGISRVRDTSTYNEFYLNRNRWRP